MTLVYADRVQETTATTGTGTYTLAGAVLDFQSFAAVGNGNTCYYTATDGTNWEVGLGTYTLSGTTLARTTILSSSNAGAAVSWAAGAKQIWLDLPAAVATYLAGGTIGSGAVVLATSPTLITPALGTPSALIGTNITGTAAGLTAGTVTTNANLTGDVTSVGNATTLTNAPVIAKVLTGYVSGAGTVSATDSILQAVQKLNGNDATNANLTGPITSSGNATAIASQTGTGSKFVVDTSPLLVTPTIGVATATSINKMAITAPATSSTLAVANGKTLTANNTLTLAGTDSTTMTFPGTSATVARTDAANTFTGVQTFSTPIAIGSGGTGVATGAFLKINVQTFSASGTYTPTTGLLYASIECVGAGGGGGGIAGNATGAGGGGGGGGGGYSRIVSTAATIGVSQTVTIGALGAGGVAGNNNGSAGGDTSVGAICIGKGGGGGGASGGGAGNAGTGGVAGTGTVAAPGAAGQPATGMSTTALVPVGGTGANGPFGGGGRGVVTIAGVNAGGAGVGFGSGGGGATAQASASNAAGGNGTVGYVVITEYLNQ